MIAGDQFPSSVLVPWANAFWKTSTRPVGRLEQDSDAGIALNELGGLSG